MQKFIFFTRTYWIEPPRLRHQLANLLHNSGNEIIFFENPNHPCRKYKYAYSSSVEKNFHFYRINDFIVYRLRFLHIFESLHAYFSKREIKKKLLHQDLSDAVIVNFNYDYYFLRDIFPDKKIITVINDDFVAQSISGYKEYTESVLAKTCFSSDVVLTVSYPLMKQLAPWCDPVLFLPWADSNYQIPNNKSNRNAVLIWCSLNDLVDYALIACLAKECKGFIFYLVGPVSISVKSILSSLTSENDNIICLPPSDLINLPLDIFFVGLMPYVSGVASTEAVTLANKSFRLMSKGLPLVVHGMPNFLKHSAIFICSDAREIIANLNYCKENFFQLQDSIEDLVSKNTSEVRCNQFLDLLSKV